MRVALRVIMVALLCLPGTSIAAVDVFEKHGRRHGVDANLLRAIALQESYGHPWTVNMAGDSFYLNSKSQMLELIRTAQENPWLLRVRARARGTKPMRYFLPTSDEASKLEKRFPQKSFKTNVRRIDVKNIDIGVMQINYRWHRRYFDSLNDMASLDKNVAYAARHLSDLIRKHGRVKGIGYYHNMTDENRWKSYSERVLSYFIKLERTRG